MTEADSDSSHPARSIGRPHSTGQRHPLGRPHQLSDSDSAFVAVECPEAPSHVAGLTLLDPATADPDAFGFHAYRDLLRERIARIDRFRWRLLEVPFGLDRAYWIEAEDFDVANHVHRVALPSPGDRETLGELVGHLHAQPLDRSRPLWESWWIEGLEGGRVATLLKFHHCLMDGQSGIELSAVLMDLSPRPDPTGRAPDLHEPTPRRPTPWEVAREAVRHAAGRPGRILHHSRRALATQWTRLDPRRAPNRAPHVPTAPFNERLSRQRRFAFATVPLGPILDAKKQFDVKVNDVLLEIVSSSIRFALQQTGELPAQPIVAICPVSLRGEDEARRPGEAARLGNRISSMSISLATHLPDPVARLYAIGESAREAKHRLEDGAAETFTILSECFVPGVLGRLTRAAHAFPSVLPLPGNLVVSNVRGLPTSTYLCGARVEEIYPLSMLQVANGINVTAVSHESQVDIGFLADARIVPDPWAYAEGVERALAELEEAVAYRARMTRREGREHAPAATAGTARASSGAEAGADTEPLDLQLIMSRLASMRAPSRAPFEGPVEPE